MFRPDRFYSRLEGMRFPTEWLPAQRNRLAGKIPHHIQLMGSPEKHQALHIQVLHIQAPAFLAARIPAVHSALANILKGFAVNSLAERPLVGLEQMPVAAWQPAEE